MNAWKTLAIVMIALLVIAIGIRFVDIEGHTFQLNETQKTFAINSSLDALKNEMGNNSYNITVQDHGRIISTANGDKKVVRVVFTNGSVILTALVDMDTGGIVEKSKVEHSGWMTEYQNQNTERLEHKLSFRAR
ncbi:MAG: hypothetical protein O8C64_11870 [Candidatus Methanoperedens sp.]|nr:hypothetical protein [Candidatus Methanoperedens sp.]MCZ7404568.1 hypothetical protein [Candidatus Methanoperedens sp.]